MWLFWNCSKLNEWSDYDLLEDYAIYSSRNHHLYCCDFKSQQQVFVTFISLKLGTGIGILTFYLLDPISSIQYQLIIPISLKHCLALAPSTCYLISLLFHKPLIWVSSESSSSSPQPPVVEMFQGFRRVPFLCLHFLPWWSHSHVFVVVVFLKLIYLFISGNFYIQCWAWTHEPKIKSWMIFQLSQPGAPSFF